MDMIHRPRFESKESIIEDQLMQDSFQSGRYLSTFPQQELCRSFISMSMSTVTKQGSDPLTGCGLPYSLFKFFHCAIAVAAVRPHCRSDTSLYRIQRSRRHPSRAYCCGLRLCLTAPAGPEPASVERVEVCQARGLNGSAITFPVSIQAVFTSVYSSIACAPFSLPIPLSLNPPKGAT